MKTEFYFLYIINMQLGDQLAAIGSQDKYLTKPKPLRSFAEALTEAVKEDITQHDHHAHIFLTDLLGKDISHHIAKVFVNTRAEHIRRKTRHYNLTKNLHSEVKANIQRSHLENWTYLSHGPLPGNYLSVLGDDMLKYCTQWSNKNRIAQHESTDIKLTPL